MPCSLAPLDVFGGDRVRAESYELLKYGIIDLGLDVGKSYTLSF